MSQDADAWLRVLNGYNYEVNLRLFAARDSYPGWFTDRIDGTRDATKAFEDRFRTLADRYPAVWYEVVFWKMFIRKQDRNRTTIRLIRNLETAHIFAHDLWCACHGYMQHTTRTSLQSLVELLWGKRADSVAIACVFPAFIAPDRFPMVDTRVAKWANACLEEHNAADDQGPQLIAPEYPSKSATVLKLRDWSFIESWIHWCRHTARKLTLLTGLDWRARDVEMAIFSAWGDKDKRKKVGIAKNRPLIDLPPVGTT